MDLYSCFLLNGALKALTQVSFTQSQSGHDRILMDAWEGGGLLQLKNTSVATQLEESRINLLTFHW